MNLTKYQINALNNCLKCSICVDSCPVAKVNPEFPGPKQLGIDWLRLAQEDGEQPSAAVGYCSNCKTCETVCPSGVHPGTLNQLAKSDLPRNGSGLREIMFSDPSRLGRLMQIWPQGGNLATSLPPVRFLMEKTIGISAKAPMPTYSTKTFRRHLQEYKPEYSQAPKEVLYFPGCFVQDNKPAIGMSLVRILTKLNYKVIVPEFRCCGQASISNARLKNTREFAEDNLAILGQHLKEGMPILFSCPSCLLTFKEEYKDILGMDEYLQFTSSMLDAGQFLMDHQDQLAAMITQKVKPSQKLAYHEPCHLRASGQGTPGLSLLNNIAGLGIVPLEAGCCGTAGSYGFKKEKQWIAREIGNNVKAAADTLNSQGIITECGMCSVQIHSLTQLPVYHPLEVLAGLIGD